MDQNSDHNSLFKQPSAWIPLAMSLAAMLLIVGYVTTFGITHQTDEGAAARIFQLLMLVQLPLAAYFAFRWLPVRPKQSLLILALQAIAWIMPIATILWLESR
jgi:hypothetical protein